MAKKLSFLEVICVALLVNVIHWHVTSSFTVDPLSSTVAEERTTAAAIEPTTPILIEETPTTGPIDCSRYPCPEDKYCAVDEASNRSECVCNTVCYLSPNPVCGSDGQTHDNDCFLRVYACQTNTVITIQHKGPCAIPTSTLPPPTSTSEISEPPTTTEATTPSSIEETTTIGCNVFECPIDKECVPDAMNRPTCSCILVCDKIYRPVCGSDIQTYYNECELRRSACLSETTITVWFTGYCETVYFGFGYPIDKVCIGFGCPVDKVCVRGADNRPTCTCILNCYYLYFPICGSDFQTHDNDCFMRRTACLANTTITILFNGTCEDNAPTPLTSTPSTPPPVTEPPSTPIPETQETQETPTTTEATVTTPSAQSTTKHRRSKCRRRKHGRRYKNKGL